MNTLLPPIYCPDAIETSNGWVDPRSNELLVAIKDLPQKRLDAGITQKLIEIVPTPEVNTKVQLLTETKEDEVVEEIQPVIPVKKPRKKRETKIK